MGVTIKTINSATRHSTYALIINKSKTTEEITPIFAKAIHLMGAIICNLHFMVTKAISTEFRFQENTIMKTSYTIQIHALIA
jgi:hypothetical protein